MKTLLRRTHRVLEQFGINPRQALLAVGGLFAYWSHLRQFRRAMSRPVPIRLYPCLSDWHSEGGNTHGEYFWQDLYVARRIFERNDSIHRHVDVGSRVDGFVAHVAAFREIEVLDVRPISGKIPGIRFQQLDLMNMPQEFERYCDSLSCLHALEHFGLGRYGDPIDPEGYDAGLRNLARLLVDGGVLYLSVPLGQERVEFNAHRVFAPSTILSLAQKYGLALSNFAAYNDSDGLTEGGAAHEYILALANKPYCLGIFEFRKCSV